MPGGDVSSTVAFTSAADTPTMVGTSVAFVSTAAVSNVNENPSSTVAFRSFVRVIGGDLASPRYRR